MVYEHLRKIKLQRASLYEPSKLRKLAANAASSFAANCTCSLKIATYNLTSCRSHLQQYKPLAAMPLATKSITCSNINHGQLFTTCSGHWQQYQPKFLFSFSYRWQLLDLSQLARTQPIVPLGIKNLKYNGFPIVQHLHQKVGSRTTINY